MKLAAWARRQGVSYKTAYRWFRAGDLPAPARQLPSGTILVDAEPVPRSEGVALYARVSSHDQKEDLARQLGRLVEHANREGLAVKASFAEVGSGLNGHRAKLMRVLGDASIGGLVVEHRERLARFGSEYVETALSASGRRLIVVEPDELKDDLVQDMVDVLTSFCARLYGRRSARNRAKRAVAGARRAG